MARNVTRLQLQNRAYQRANMENHIALVPVTEAQDALNEVIPEVYDLLVAAGPADYYSNETTIATVAGTFAYPLPADFYQLRAVFVDEGNGEFRSVAEVNEQERQYSRAPAGAYNVIVRYIPACPLLTSDGATFDGVSGWDELIVIGTAIKLLTKEGTMMNVLGLLQGERARVEARIRNMAGRNPGEPQRVLRRSLRYRDTFRAWANTVDAYKLRAGNIEILRTAGGFLL